MTAGELRRLVQLIEQDHELLNRQTTSLGRALESLRRGTDSAGAVNVLEDLRRYFVDQLLPHMQEEEQEFFPIVAQALRGGARQVGRLRAEHRALEEDIERFRSELTLSRFVAPPAEEAVLGDLVAVGRQLWARLRDHARLENRLLARLKRTAA
ncbi:MAG: hemerythrin domain-containing protein [Pirellulales bacterium]